MGKVVHTVFTALCSVIYGGIQEARRDRMSNVDNNIITNESGKETSAPKEEDIGNTMFSYKEILDKITNISIELLILGVQKI